MYRQANTGNGIWNMATKKTRRTLVEERFEVLKALLREAKRLKSISKKQADDIFENACSAKGHLTPELQKQIGEALSKTEGIEKLPSDSQRS